MEERKAIETAKDLLDEFDRRFSEQVLVGPIDPVVSLRTILGELVTRSQSTSTLTLALDRRIEFAARHAPELWAAVQRDRMCEPEEQG